MAFSIERKTRITAGGNTKPASGTEGANSLYAYTETTETMANITASAYFNDWPQLAVGDAIYIVASDDVAWYYVTAITPNVTVNEVSDAAELDLPQGNLIVGDANGKGTPLAPGAANTVLQTNGTTLNYSLVDTDNIADAAVTQDKIDQSMIRFTVSYFLDGKATNAVWATNTHPKAQLVSGFVQLVEIPDAPTETITVLVQNATGTVSMTDTLTFTAGTDTMGVTKAFTPVTAGDADEILKADVLNIITAGTTTTDGAVIVNLEFVAIP